MATQRISVIIPVYKTEEYLARCLESILAQSYQNIEILLVDDGSPDRCPQICDEWAQNYENIRVIHKENGGLSSARNAGIEAATGKYIAFVDSDDAIEKNMLERLYFVAEKHQAEVAMLQYAEVQEGNEPPIVQAAEERVYRGEEIKKAFLQLKIDSVCVGLYLRTAMQDQRFLEGKTSEDIPFNFEVFQKINTFVYLPERRYYYYYHTQSMSNGCLNKNMFNYLNFRKDIYEFYAKGERSDLTEMAEVLYARAAMGLLTRMAVFGIAPSLDEKECKTLLKSVLREHKKVFFQSKEIPFSRKILGYLGLYAYPLLKIIGRIKR